MLTQNGYSWMYLLGTEWTFVSTYLCMACTEDSDWGNSVSRITHTKEENLKRIRKVNGSLFTPSFPIRGPSRNCVSFCGIGTPKGSSKRFPCHSVQYSKIYISCSLEKHIPHVWDLQVWPQLPKPGFSYNCKGGGTCLLVGQSMAGEPGHLLRCFYGHPWQKKVVMSVPATVWRYRYHHWGALWGVSNLSLILASVWGDLSVPPMKVYLSQEQAVHGVSGPDFPTSEVVLLCW